MHTAMASAVSATMPGRRPLSEVGEGHRRSPTARLGAPLHQRSDLEDEAGAFLVRKHTIDVQPGTKRSFRVRADAQTWAAVGVQGLAPGWFEVEATGYVGAGARTQARFEVEYDLLLTNRLVLQPLVELEMYGKRDPERGIGAGLSSLETGVRLRYEIRREFAPHVGVVWDRKLFGTADFARADGEDVSRVKLALGLRTWF